MATTHIKLKSLIPESMHINKQGPTPNNPEDERQISDPMSETSNKNMMNQHIMDMSTHAVDEDKSKRLKCLKKMKEQMKSASYANGNKK